MIEYYNILGVGYSATQDEIKRAFHKLAHKHHPDKGGSEVEFKKINEAYQWLTKNHIPGVMPQKPFQPYQQQPVPKRKGMVYDDMGFGDVFAEEAFSKWYKDFRTPQFNGNAGTTSNPFGQMSAEFMGNRFVYDFNTKTWKKI